MQFKKWIKEAEQNVFDPNYGLDHNETPASNMVKQTGLQPQVGADVQSIPLFDLEQDKILALDSGLEHLEKQLPTEMLEKTPKLNMFKTVWSDMIQKWNQIKMSQYGND